MEIKKTENTVEKLHVDLQNYKLRIEQTDEESFSVKCVECGTHLTVTETDGVLSIVEPKEFKFAFQYDWSAEQSCTIQIPRSRRLAVEVSVVNGSVEIVGDYSNVSLKTVNGKIILENVKAVLAAVETVNGKIKGILTANQAKTSTVNGKIELSTDIREFSAKTVNGGIDVMLTGKLEEYELNSKKREKTESYHGTGERKAELTTVNGGIDYSFFG